MTEVQDATDRATQSNSTSILVTIALILGGVLLFLIAQWAPFLGADDSWQRDLVGSLGVFLVGVVAIG